MSAVSDILLAPDVRPFAVAAAIMVVTRRHRIADDAGRLLDQRTRRPRCRARQSTATTASAACFSGSMQDACRCLILIILALGVFSIEGFLLQGIAHGAGAVLPVWIAALAALGRQHPRDPSDQPRHRPHHPARRDLCGERSRFRRPCRRRFRSDRSTRDCPAASVSRMSSATGTPCRRAPVPIQQPLPVGASVLLVDRDARSFIAISAPADLIDTTTIIRQELENVGTRSTRRHWRRRHPCYRTDASRRSTGVRPATKPMSAPASAARRSCSTAARWCCRFSIPPRRSI